MKSIAGAILRTRISVEPDGVINGIGRLGGAAMLIKNAAVV